MTPDAIRAGASSGARVVLVSPYELGRQPFNLAQPAAWFARAAVPVACLDLSQQKLDPTLFRDAEYVAIYLGMHTATRIAAAALPRIRALAPHARIAAFGLYAPVNAAWLKSLGVEAVFGGESEPDLLAWVQTGVAPAGSGLADIGFGCRHVDQFGFVHVHTYKLSVRTSYPKKHPSGLVLSANGSGQLNAGLIIGLAPGILKPESPVFTARGRIVGRSRHFYPVRQVPQRPDRPCRIFRRLLRNHAPAGFARRNRAGAHAPDSRQPTGRA